MNASQETHGSHMRPQGHNDECLVNNGGCDQTCENTPGSYRCICLEGYKLLADKKTCDVVQPRQAILIETTHDRSDTPPHQNSPRLRFQVTPPTVVPLLDEEFRQYLALEGLDIRHSCVRGTFGPGCMFNCDDCQNGGKCDVRALSCTCQPGFTGLLCNETCPKDTYGDGCTKKCRCQNGGICDPATGECTCPPGIQGKKCEDGCPPGKLLTSLLFDKI
ncbi:multiple epidermal growth factor-like domains protein 6 [Trichonephila clavipes]|nr:multiple epidermal growth factor-like domains protein 6 [Trichonephila clavipes]